MRLFGCVFAVCSIFAIANKGYAADVEPVPAPPPPAGPNVILTAHALDEHGNTLVEARIGVADEANAVRAIKMDPDKLAGINLPAEEPFMDPEDVLEGKHRPRGEILYYGEQLIMEVYEDDPATFRFDEPFLFDEFVMVLSGKLILTGTDGVSQEYAAGDSLVVPKGFTGTWQMLGHYRELVAIERNAYEKAYGAPEQ